MRQGNMPSGVLGRLGRQLLAAVLSAGVLGAATTLRAETLPGSTHPEFRSALESWLADDEAQSLPALARLAQDGNGAARVLLGLIDKKSSLQGPWISALPRQDRIALLRAQGGLSGRNWMAVAAPGIDYAQLWNRLWQLDGGLDIAQGFAAKGDSRAVREALLVLASRQEGSFPPEVLATDWFPAALSYLVAEWPAAPGDIPAPDQGDPQLGMVGQTVDHGHLRTWLGQAELAAPLQQVCDIQCPQQSQECALALYEGLGSYPGLVRLGAPLPYLDAPEGFFRTPRGRASLARRIMLTRSTRMREADLARLADISSCAADWLSSEYARYAYSVPNIPLPAE
ncbi:hypothetical protein [Roseinatronobacter alkalisoli]|uniref:Uncharacterized protein n=1 Tax=Roseinatronobacter alkalisoli TaxID=3028235 RepID=A0ABT5T8U2_9RHOB|nr:hypothetical protein [Roseinatronobacter sp. HJB301]MDD7970353.1 hypothetical protein [Roseinatronobacter sp. HJB301]